MVVGVLARAAEGDIADLVELCEHILDTDGFMQSLYETRVARVAQADWIIAPNPAARNDQEKRLAKMAANFVQLQFSRIESPQQVIRDAMHAIFVGFNAGENEWAFDGRDNYIKRVKFVHGRRFRYDEVWNLRLYDRGRRIGEGSAYGEMLEPNLWTIHEYRAKPAYKGSGGLIRSVLVRWLFRRWADTWRIQGAEKFGNPMLRVMVPKGTKESVRQELLNQLDQMSSEHVGVFEEGNEVVVDVSAQSANSHEALQQYLADNKAELEISMLGASETVTQGANGSQASNTTRVGTALDPRMVSDGAMVSDGFQLTTFSQYINLNPHVWLLDGSYVDPALVPVPIMRARTADDEIRRDHSDLEAEIAAIGSPAPITVQSSDGPLPNTPAAAAMDSGQVKTLMEIATSVRAGDITPEQGKAMVAVAYPSIDPARAAEIVGMPDMKTTPAASPAASPQSPQPAKRAPKPAPKKQLALPEVEP